MLTIKEVNKEIFAVRWKFSFDADRVGVWHHDGRFFCDIVVLLLSGSINFIHSYMKQMPAKKIEVNTTD